MPEAAVSIVEETSPISLARSCRRMIVGPGVNQPDPFTGYTGMVGWSCPARLRNGTMLITFSAGYWHASYPTPLKFGKGYMDSIIKAGYPVGFDAPRGGRAMIVRSDDNGATWSRPRTLIDTPWDDRSPSIRELSDGTLICTFLTWPNDDAGSSDGNPSKGVRVGFIRSFDGGDTWESEPRRLPPVYMSESPGHEAPVVELADGTILQAVHGWHQPHRGGNARIGVFASKDRGEAWERRAEIASDHSLCEPEIARLSDGTLVILTRDEGDITWSTDNGHTWTKPVTFGVRMFAPALCVLSDSTLLCTFGSFAKPGGLCAILSTDNGHTWIAPSKDRGFFIDQTYGYSQSCLMPDGTVFITYLQTGGHKRQDAENNAIWAIRLRVREDHAGIDLLPPHPSAENAVGPSSDDLPDAGRPIPNV